MAVEQLRRAVPGGIGAYARGLLAGIAQCAEDGDAVDVTLLASRRPGRLVGGSGRPRILAQFGRPTACSRCCPGPLLTRGWDHGLVRPPGGFDVVHSISSGLPAARRGATGGPRSVVTVHDVAWRRHPEPRPRRGARVARGLPAPRPDSEGRPWS